MNDGRFCLRCLLSDLSDMEEAAREVGAQIDALPSENRVNEQTRTERLTICRECGYLENATCALCGCYVDFRAAQRWKACPDIPPRWEAERST